MWYCMLTDAIDVLKETLHSQRLIEDIIQNFVLIFFLSPEGILGDCLPFIKLYYS